MRRIGRSDRLHRRPGRRSLLSVAALVGLALVLSACASNAPLDTLEPKGPDARSIDQLINPVFIIAGVIFVLVQGAVLVAAFKFRVRRDAEDDTWPDQIEGHTKAELTWTIVPALLMATIGFFTLITLFDLAESKEGALNVRVEGQQWWWSYHYYLDGTEDDARGDGPADIVTATELVVPAGEPVQLQITSRDVIHSFWIPPLNGKRDAVPDLMNPLRLEADEPGVYEGQCTEYCGLSHGYMRMKVVALPRAEFDEWAEAQMQPAERPADASEAAERGLEVFRSTCSSCHLVTGGDWGNEDVYDPDNVNQVSERAPNLTHLMSRTTFAGAIFDLYNADGSFNRPKLEAWIRNAPHEKPMAPEGNRADNRPRGMVAFPGLSTEQVDDLVAYLMTLGPEPSYLDLRNDGNIRG